VPTSTFFAFTRRSAQVGKRGHATGSLRLSGHFEMLEDEGVHVESGTLAEYAVDMTVARNDVAPVQVRAIALPQQPDRLLRALREKTGVLGAMDEGDRDGEASEVGKVDVLPINRPQPSGADHEGEVLHRVDVGYPEHFVEGIVRGPVELIVLVEKGVHKGDSMADSAGALLFLVVGESVEESVVQPAEPVGVGVGVGGERFDAELVEQRGQVI
jgi:hypothetical protein